MSSDSHDECRHADSLYGRCMDCGMTWADQLAEQGRRLASERDDLIVQGADPAGLDVPLHPQSGDQESGR